MMVCMVLVKHIDIWIIVGAIKILTKPNCREKLKEGEQEVENDSNGKIARDTFGSLSEYWALDGVLEILCSQPSL